MRGGGVSSKMGGERERERQPEVSRPLMQEEASNIHLTAAEWGRGAESGQGCSSRPLWAKNSSVLSVIEQH